MATAETGACLNAPKVQEKHVELLNAIDRLEEVSNSFRRFIDKVGNYPPPVCETGEIRGEQSLYEVLCSAPNRIADFSESIQNKINELESLLF